MFSAQPAIEETASEPPAEAAAAAEPVASDTEAPKEAVCAIPRFVCDMVLIILQKEEKNVRQTAAKVGRRLSSRVGSSSNPRRRRLLFRLRFTKTLRRSTNLLLLPP